MNDRQLILPIVEGSEGTPEMRLSHCQGLWLYFAARLLPAIAHTNFTSVSHAEVKNFPPKCIEYTEEVLPADIETTVTPCQTVSAISIRFNKDSIQIQPHFDSDSSSTEGHENQSKLDQ